MSCNIQPWPEWYRQWWTAEKTIKDTADLLDFNTQAFKNHIKIIIDEIVKMSTDNSLNADSLINKPYEDIRTLANTLNINIKELTKNTHDKALDVLWREIN